MARSFPRPLSRRRPAIACYVLNVVGVVNFYFPIASPLAGRLLRRHYSFCRAWWSKALADGGRETRIRNAATGARRSGDGRAAKIRV